MQNGMRTLENRAEVYNYCSFAPGVQTNYDVKANVAASFEKLARVGYIYITTSSDIVVKFNDTGLAGIPVTATRPLELDVLAIENIYITVASGTPTITILSTF